MAQKKDKNPKPTHVEGAYIGGNVNTGGGDFVGRDKVVHGDVNSVTIRGDATGNTFVTGKDNVVTNQTVKIEQVLEALKDFREALPQSGLDKETAEDIQVVVQNAETQLARPEPKKHLVLPKLESVVATLTGLVGAGEAVRKLLPMAQQALAWAQQLLK